MSGAGSGHSVHVAFRTAAISVGTVPQPVSEPRHVLLMLALGHCDHLAVCFLSPGSLRSHLSLVSFHQWPGWGFGKRVAWLLVDKGKGLVSEKGRVWLCVIRPVPPKGRTPRFCLKTG